MSVVQPYTISVPDEAIALLKAKLESTRFPDELEDAEWLYGAPLVDIKRLVERWKDGYDWRKHEAELNEELPQFKVDIEVDGFETLNIHFVHKKSNLDSAIPLVFVHGWPGSILEVRKILPLLTAVSPDHPSFHVVALSLPNFGFSEGTKKKGFGIAQYAEVAHKLMLALGYEQYVAQGGDWGHLVRCHFSAKYDTFDPEFAQITKMLARAYGTKHVKAWHTNTPIAVPPKLSSNPIICLQHLVTPYTAAEKAGIERGLWFRKSGRGYFDEQSTQPQTLGYSLADSPSGLLAWIYEKLINWTDSYPWTDDEVLTWVSVYWFSRVGPAASVRIYYEATQGPDIVASYVPKVPLGISNSPKDLSLAPRSWMKAIGNLVFMSEHENGGHFTAYEKPNELVRDLHQFLGKGGPAHGVVEGFDGYSESLRS
ncbi:alpha/beta-hydrolase [Schizopora paradoxa]|uniref:Alpha/beta-hydrolase n=1 Tax=Schizopora paradoxa TaxID=27342 RepID=A0A0H2RWZ5_9AGAM|nr:alpha/beta-hydrolase [Schizopora paradoxa]